MSFTNVLQYLPIIVVILCRVSEQASMPSYMTACSKRDREELNKCALEAANHALPFIVKGDKKIGIKPLNPLKLPLVDLQAAESFNLKFTDLCVYGIEDTTLTKLDIDLQELTVKVEGNIPILRFGGPYKIKGRILVLPIDGEGNSNITFANMNFVTNFQFIIEDKAGKDYAKIQNIETNYVIEKAVFKLDNLLQEQGGLGDQMNNVMNDNWKAVHDDLYPSIREIINQVITSVTRNIFIRIPFNELFLE